MINKVQITVTLRNIWPQSESLIKSDLPNTTCSQFNVFDWINDNLS